MVNNYYEQFVSLAQKGFLSMLGLFGVGMILFFACFFLVAVASGIMTISGVLAVMFIFVSVKKILKIN